MSHTRSQLLETGRTAPWKLSAEELIQYRDLEMCEDHEFEEFCRDAPLLSAYPPDAYADEPPGEPVSTRFEPTDDDRAAWAAMSA